jgi:hypothetical protein
MSRRYPCLLAALLLGAGLAQADPHRQAGIAERFWVWNLGGRPAEAALESSDAAGVQEMLLIKASEDFDPRSLEIERQGEVRREKVGKRLRARVIRPAWAQELLGMEASSARILAGQTVEAKAEAGPDGRVRLAAGLEKDSAITVTVKDEGGAVVRSFSAASSVPVRWRVDLGSAADLEGARLELRVDRGGVVAGVPVARGGAGKGGLRSITAATTVGTISFSQTINYSGSLYFYVSGGPPSTCGELSTYRNGSWLFAANYVCTNSSGNATMGPWTWDNTPSDQTDDPLYVRWPDNSTTNNIWHIWDKTCATSYIDSPSGSPPTSWYGHATDAAWGAGFNSSWTTGFAFFEDTTADREWSPSSGAYNQFTADVPLTITGQPGFYISWSSQFPAASAHVSGHIYSWNVCITDGSCGYCDWLSFTAP